MQAYKADTAWNRGIPCIFFKILIQIYLLRSFLYYLTYCIKEVINGNIFWRFNLEVLAYGQLRPETGVYLAMFQNTNPIVLVFLFLYFWLTVSKRVSKAIFLDIKFKSVGLWGSYGLKQRNPLQNLHNNNQIIFGST